MVLRRAGEKNDAAELIAGRAIRPSSFPDFGLVPVLVCDHLVASPGRGGYRDSALQSILRAIE